MLAGGLPTPLSFLDGCGLTTGWTGEREVGPAGLEQPEVPGSAGRRCGSTGVAWGQCRCPDRWNSSAVPRLSGELLQP